MSCLCLKTPMGGDLCSDATYLSCRGGDLCSDATYSKTASCYRCYQAPRVVIRNSVIVLMSIAKAAKETINIAKKAVV